MLILMLPLVKGRISPNDILTTMQGYFGGLYASNFNRFGKMYRVMIQAEPEATKNLESLNSIKIRNGNEMALFPSSFLSRRYMDRTLSAVSTFIRLSR